MKINSINDNNKFDDDNDGDDDDKDLLLSFLFFFSAVVLSASSCFSSIVDLLLYARWTASRLVDREEIIVGVDVDGVGGIFYIVGRFMLLLLCVVFFFRFLQSVCSNVCRTQLLNSFLDYI